MRIFLDTEFTALSRHGQLLSLALVTEQGRDFYAEFDDYDATSINPWVRDNVLPQMQFGEKASGWVEAGHVYRAKGDRAHVRNQITQFLQEESRGQALEFWADNHAYDWVFFCDLWGTALDLPKTLNIHYIVRDLCTLLECKGIDPNTPRTDLIQAFGLGHLLPPGDAHNALWDAWALQVLWAYWHPKT